jgi:hypothetical protein
LGRLRCQTRDSFSWAELVESTFNFAEGFLRPKQIRSEIELVLSEIEKDRPRAILEIGTARGGTFFLLSRAAAPNAVLISVDLPGGKGGGGYARWRARIFGRLLLPGQEPHFLRTNSHDPESFEKVKQILNGRKLDLLFIDGDHSYDGVKTDYRIYSRLVREGGIIAFHDIVRHAEGLECEVDQFWQEIKADCVWREFIEDPAQGWAGIGILRQYGC